MNSRLTNQIQHAIQYPSGHLDRWASFGPAFEMTDATQDATRPDQPSTPPAQPARSADIPSVSASFDAKRFILGGRAIFTLQGLEERYTYRVSRSDPDDHGNTVLFVSLLTGPDNGADYTYLGLLTELSGQIRLTRKSRYTDDSRPVKALRWACARIWAGREISPARLYHEGSCGRCGRALTVPSSIESGFGPECILKVGG